MLRSHQLLVVAAGSARRLQSIVFAAELQWRKVRYAIQLRHIATRRYFAMFDVLEMR